MKVALSCEVYQFLVWLVSPPVTVVDVVLRHPTCEGSSWKISRLCEACVLTPLGVEVVEALGEFSNKKSTPLGVRVVEDQVNL